MNRGRFVSRWVLATLMTVGLAVGQYGSIAVDGSGRRVWFATSRALRDDPTNAQSRVYEALPAGPVLISDATQVADKAAQTPQVSDDGDVVAWSVMSHTRSSSGLGSSIVEVYGTVIRRASDGKSWKVGAAGGLSRNGRWFATSERVIDLNSESVQEEGWSFDRSLMQVADNGSHLDYRGGSPALVRPDGQWSVLPVSFCSAPVMDRHASVLVGVVDPANRLPCSGRDILLYGIASGVQTVLVPQCENCQVLSISGDGSRILFTGVTREEREANSEQRPQLHLIDRVTGEVGLLTAGIGTVSLGKLSSDGSRFCFVPPGSGEIRCQTIESEESEVVSAAIADLDLSGFRYGSCVPGSRCQVPGAGLHPVRLSVDGLEIPLLDVRQERLLFILPWNAEPDSITIEVDKPQSPFAPVRGVLPIRASAPRFVRTSDLGGKSVVPDWHYLENGTRGGLVTQVDPIRPSEELWVHVDRVGRDPGLLSWLWGGDVTYFLGTGPEDRSMASVGAASIAVPILPLSAEYEEGDRGWYVFKFRIPQDSSTGIVFLQVGVPRMEDVVPVYVAAP